MKLNDERYRAMLQGRRAVRRIPFPGAPAPQDGSAPAHELGVRILTADEQAMARGDATQYVAARAKALSISAAELMLIDPELFDLEVQRCMIQRAFVQPEPDDKGNYEPMWPSPTAVRQLPDVMVAALFDVYRAHQDFTSPLVSAGEFDEVFEDLKKGDGASATTEALTQLELTLMLYDAPTLRRCSRTLAELLVKSTTGQ